MDWDDINETELTWLAQENNPNAHRSLGRERLLAIVMGEDVDLPDRAVDKVRLRIMEFVDQHWTQVEPLLACPARTRDPRACFNCTDVQVVECALSNNKKIFGKD
jgi:hypothetical protein